jgi:hypothetical protein
VSQMANWQGLFVFIYNNESPQYIQPILNDTINETKLSYQ